MKEMYHRFCLSITRQVENKCFMYFERIGRSSLSFIEACNLVIVGKYKLRINRVNGNGFLESLRIGGLQLIHHKRYDPVYKSISRDEKALELFYLKYQDEYYHIVEQKDETELKILRERISNDLWNDAIMSFSYCFGG